MAQLKLPQDWLKIQLGDVVSYGKTQKCELSDVANDTWVLELEDIEKESSRIISRKTASERPFKSTKNRFERGNVLYGKLRPYLNKVAVADTDGVCTTEIIPLDSEPFVLNRYLFHWLKTRDFLNYVNEVSYGVNMPRLGTKDGVAAPFVLAPLAEQKIIADKLDTLLAQVETTKARLERIPQILNRFRQSVLAAAVSGRLTEDLRKNSEYEPSFYEKELDLPSDVTRGGKQKIKGVLDLSNAWLPELPNGWVYRTVDQLYQTNHVFEYVDGNHGSLYPRKEDFSDEGVLFLTATQLDESSEVKWQAVPRLAHIKAKSLVKGWAKAGDVLLTHNATVGRTAIVADDFEESFLLGTSVTLYRTSDSNIVRKYLYYFFSSRAWQSQLEAVMEQSTRNQVSITKQALMSIALPPLAEQTEIVRRVDQLFAHADRIEQQVNNALARVNNLTQSILAKAFRGELTEQWRKDNPELISGENSAEALLERIRAERAAVKPVKRTRNKRTTV